jgi:head-tail adaptor
MANLKAGELRHRITVQQFAAVNSGEATEEQWTDFATNIPAQWIPASGRELAVAHSTSASFGGKWRIRYGAAAGVTAAMRVVHDGKNYNLTSEPIPDETMRDAVLLPCEAGIRG